MAQGYTSGVPLPITLANGGTSAPLSPSNGGIFYSTASAGAILAGTATAGQVLQSGASTTPAWSTATFPATATGTGTILRADGTNWVATTSTYPNTNAVSTLLYASSANVMGALATANNGLLVTSNSGVPSILSGPGATGKVLQSNSAAAPSFSTATYPATATGTGTVLVADGTNWVASTPTFPALASATARKIIVSDATNWVASTETYAAPGTAGNVMTSNGTNWTAVQMSGLTYVSKNITSAQIKLLHGTPVEVVAAPSSGKVLCIVGPVYAKFIYGGSNVFTAGAAQTINVAYGTSLVAADIAVTNAALVASSSQYLATTPTVAATAIANLEARSLVLYNPVATEISGNAAGNNTITVSFLYYTISI